MSESNFQRRSSSRNKPLGDSDSCSMTTTVGVTSTVNVPPVVLSPTATIQMTTVGLMTNSSMLQSQTLKKRQGSGHTQSSSHNPLSKTPTPIQPSAGGVAVANSEMKECLDLNEILRSFQAREHSIETLLEFLKNLSITQQSNESNLSTTPVASVSVTSVTDFQEKYNTSMKQERIRYETEERTIKKYFNIKADEESLREVVITHLLNKILICLQATYHKLLEGKHLDAADHLLLQTNSLKEEVHRHLRAHPLRFTSILISVCSFSRSRLASVQAKLLAEIRAFHSSIRNSNNNHLNKNKPTIAPATPDNNNNNNNNNNSSTTNSSSSSSSNKMNTSSNNLKKKKNSNSKKGIIKTNCTASTSIQDCQNENQSNKETKQVQNLSETNTNNDNSSSSQKMSFFRINPSTPTSNNGNTNPLFRTSNQQNESPNFSSSTQSQSGGASKIPKPIPIHPKTPKPISTPNNNNMNSSSTSAITPATTITNSNGSTVTAEQISKAKSSAPLKKSNSLALSGGVTTSSSTTIPPNQLRIQCQQNPAKTKDRYSSTTSTAATISMANRKARIISTQSSKFQQEHNASPKAIRLSTEIEIIPRIRSSDSFDTPFDLLNNIESTSPLLFDPEIEIDTSLPQSQQLQPQSTQTIVSNSHRSIQAKKPKILLRSIEVASTTTPSISPLLPSSSSVIVSQSTSATPTTALSAQQQNVRRSTKIKTFLQSVQAPTIPQIPDSPKNPPIMALSPTMQLKVQNATISLPAAATGSQESIPNPANIVKDKISRQQGRARKLLHSCYTSAVVAGTTATAVTPSQFLDGAPIIPNPLIDLSRKLKQRSKYLSEKQFQQQQYSLYHSDIAFDDTFAYLSQQSELLSATSLAIQPLFAPTVSQLSSTPAISTSTSNVASNPTSESTTELRIQIERLYAQMLRQNTSVKGTLNNFENYFKNYLQRSIKILNSCSNNNNNSNKSNSASTADPQQQSNKFRIAQEQPHASLFISEESDSTFSKWISPSLVISNYNRQSLITSNPNNQKAFSQTSATFFPSSMATNSLFSKQKRKDTHHQQQQNQHANLNMKISTQSFQTRVKSAVPHSSSKQQQPQPSPGNTLTPLRQLAQKETSDFQPNKQFPANPSSTKSQKHTLLTDDQNYYYNYSQMAKLTSASVQSPQPTPLIIFPPSTPAMMGTSNAFFPSKPLQKQPNNAFSSNNPPGRDSKRSDRIKQYTPRGANTLAIASPSPILMNSAIVAIPSISTSNSILEHQKTLFASLLHDDPELQLPPRYRRANKYDTNSTAINTNSNNATNMLSSQKCLTESTQYQQHNEDLASIAVAVIGNSSNSGITTNNFDRGIYKYSSSKNFPPPRTKHPLQSAILPQPQQLQIIETVQSSRLQLKKSNQIPFGGTTPSHAKLTMMGTQNPTNVNVDLKHQHTFIKTTFPDSLQSVNLYSK